VLRAFGTWPGYFHPPLAGLVCGSYRQPLSNPAFEPATPNRLIRSLFFHSRCRLL